MPPNNLPPPAPSRSVPLRTAGGALVLAIAAGATALLGRWEPSHTDPGLVYADKLAGGLPTVCRGITRHVTSTPLVVGDRWPAAKCQAEEDAALLKVQRQIAACFTGPTLPQSVFDAATSHAWNFGAGATCGSQAMRAWNQGYWELGCGRIARGDDGRLVWVYAGGKFVQGLANRRADEVKTCMKDVKP